MKARPASVPRCPHPPPPGTPCITFPTIRCPHCDPRDTVVCTARLPRLQIEYFPGYSPDLNPVEYVWGDFKRHDANGLPLSKQNIRQNLHADARRVRRSQRKLRSFVLASELPSPPW